MKRLRSLLDTGRAALTFTLVTGYELVVKHGFGLRTFLVASVAEEPPEPELDLGYVEVLQMKLILLGRYALRRQDLFEAWFDRVEAAMLTRLRRTPPDPEDLISPLPTITVEDIDSERFHRDYVMRGRAVVIRGAVADSEACRRWSAEFFRAYADAPVQIRDPARESEYPGTLAEVLDSVGTENRLYIYGATNLMRDHEELVEQLGVLDYRAHMTRRPAGYAGSQLFLGVHRQSGSGWHCATGNNLFFMVRGRKRWTFIHPDYTWLVYPLVNKTCQTLISPMLMLMGRRYDADYLREHFPLFEYCPRQEVTLEPGDVLFNPSWNWHDVENLTEESVAVSSRWIQPLAVSHNRLIEFFMLFSPYLNRRRFTAIRQRGFSISDESVREVYRSMDHRVDFGRPGAFARMCERYGFDALERT
jgi:hypothetical protein